MKKIIFPGLVSGIVMLVLGFLVSYLFMLIPAVTADYHNASIMRPWADPLMSLYFIYPFILGICLAWFWNKSKTVFKGKPQQRALQFGYSMFFISTVPGMLVSYSSFPLSLWTIISWTVSGLINAVAAGMVFVRMNK